MLARLKSLAGRETARDCAMMSIVNETVVTSRLGGDGGSRSMPESTDNSWRHVAVRNDP